MKRISEFIYKNNYKTKAILIFILSAAIVIARDVFSVEILSAPSGNTAEFHSGILTINSIFSGFALTNLGILLSISDDQLVEKLKGTDILLKRNNVIGHSIIFGSISILISMLYVFNFNPSILFFLGKELKSALIYYAYVVEIVSLFASILYFLLSIKKMIQLLAYIYVPKKKYSDQQIKEMRERLK